MKRKEAIALAKKMALEGEHNDAIAKKLAEMGHVSGKTGKPLGPVGISYMLIKAGFRRRKTRATKETKARVVSARGRNKELVYNRTGSKTLDMIADLLTAPNLSMETRCATIRELAKNL